jgi:peptidoglycan/LPS O-acetylase OafA/YrhL
MRIVTTHKYEALDGLRGIAALCVMAGHICETLHIPWWPPNLFLAVDVFFMMSGFVIAHSYGQRLHDTMSAWTYLGRRIVRLYPMFIAGLLIGVGALCLGVSNGAIDYRGKDILVGTLLNAAYLPFLNTARIGPLVGSIFPADPPAWSLLLEMLASAGFLLLFGLRRTTLLAIALACLGLTVAAGIYFGRAPGGTEIWLNNGWGTKNMLGGLPRVGFGFTFGVLLYRLSHAVRARRLASALAHAPYASFALYAVLFAVLIFPKYARGLYPLAVLTVVAPAIVVASAFLRPRNGPEIKVAWFLGWISYPIYCLHYPILRWVLFSGVAGPGIPAIAAVSAVATLLAAVALTKWYDEPVRAVLSRRLSPPRQPALSGAG